MCKFQFTKKCTFNFLYGICFLTLLLVDGLLYHRDQKLKESWETVLYQDYLNGTNSCLHNNETESHSELCTEKTFEKSHQCEVLVNGVYSVQYRSHNASNQFKINCDINETIEIIATLVSGGCLFDCSGLADSFCVLRMRSVRLQITGNVPFSFNDLPTGYHCFRIQLVGYDQCILYTKIYQTIYNFSTDLTSVHLEIARMILLGIPIFLLVVMSITLIYLYVRCHQKRVFPLDPKDTPMNFYYLV